MGARGCVRGWVAWGVGVGVGVGVERREVQWSGVEREEESGGREERGIMSDSMSVWADLKSKLFNFEFFYVNYFFCLLEAFRTDSEGKLLTFEFCFLVFSSLVLSC